MPGTVDDSQLCPVRRATPVAAGSRAESQVLSLHVLTRRYLVCLLLVLMVGLSAWVASISLVRRSIHASINSHRFDEAEAAVDRLRFMMGSDGEALLRRARIERLRGNAQEAIASLSRAFNEGASIDDVRHEQLLWNVQFEYSTVSQRKVQSVLDQNLEFAQPMYEALAIAQSSAGDWESASALLERWQKRAPDDALPHLYQGMVRAELQQTQLAETALRRARSLNPKLVSAQFELAKVLAEQGEEEESLRIVRSFINAVPDHLEARRLRAGLLRDSPSQKVRLEDLRFILSKHPGDYDARCELALTYVRNQSGSRAIDALAPIMFDFDSDGLLNYLLAAAYELVGNDAEADRHHRCYLDACRQLQLLTDLAERSTEPQLSDEMLKRLALGFTKYRWQQAGRWVAAAQQRVPDDAEIVEAAEAVARQSQELSRFCRFANAADGFEPTGRGVELARGPFGLDIRLPLGGVGSTSAAMVRRSSGSAVPH